MGIIKFMKYYVTDGTIKARVHYSSSAIVGDRKCVTLYAKTHDDGSMLAKIFPSEYINNTDLITDYFEKGKIRIMENDPRYHLALGRCRKDNMAPRIRPIGDISEIYGSK